MALRTRCGERHPGDFVMRAGLAAGAEDAGGEDGHPEEDVADGDGDGSEDGSDDEAAVFSEEGADASADGGADEREEQRSEDGGERDVHIYSRVDYGALRCYQSWLCRICLQWQTVAAGVFGRPQVGCGNFIVACAIAGFYCVSECCADLANNYGTGCPAIRRARLELGEGPRVESRQASLV